jgi:hypothetical protein
MKKRDRQNDPNQMTRFLWVGSAKECETLFPIHHFDHVINVDRKPDEIHLYRGAKRHFFPMWDLSNLLDKNKTEQVRQTIIEVVKLLLEITRQERTVFLHCQVGQSRSISIVVAYIMIAFEKTSVEAQQYVFYRRRISFVKRELLIIATLAAGGIVRGENPVRDEMIEPVDDEEVDPKDFIGKEPNRQ